MIKPLLTILVVLALSGCENSKEFSESARVQCLDGVKYWVVSETPGYRASMAVYLNPKTLQPENCGYFND